MLISTYHAGRVASHHSILIWHIHDRMLKVWHASNRGFKDVVGRAIIGKHIKIVRARPKASTRSDVALRLKQIVNVGINNG